MSAAPDWDREGRGWPHREASRFVAAGGLDWHVQVLGEGPALLLLHGTGAATHSWRGLMPRLAERFTVVAPDLPGHGFTRGRPPGGLALTAIAGATASLLDKLATKPALVAGHSAGAAIAARMAFDGSHRAPIVAFAPALLPFPGLAAHVFPAFAKLLFLNPLASHLFARIARIEGEVGRFLKRSTGSAIDAEGVGLYARLFASPGHCAGAVEMMADWDLGALKRHLPRLPVPMLIVHGGEDGAVPPSAAREAARLVPDARLEEWPGLGHLAHEERPEQAAEAIMAFAEKQAVR
ncbi:MAG: alpha/beta fold hydrolase BchO [Sphingomonadaceae bacterium]